MSPTEPALLAPTVVPTARWPDVTVWRARAALGLVLAAAALTGPVGYLGQNAYAAVVGLGGLVCLPFLGVRRGPMIALGILLALALWSVVSMTWSVDLPVHPDLRRYKVVESLTAMKLVLEVGLYGAFVVVAREAPGVWASRILAVFAVSLGLVTLLMTVDAASGEAIYRALRLSAHAANKPEIIQRNAGRGCFTVALLFWPVALWLHRTGRTLGAAALAIGLVVSSFGLHVDSPVVALVLGGAVFFAVQRFGRPVIWALLGATVLYFAFAPAVFAFAGQALPHWRGDQGLAKASWGIRLDIWRFASARISERPWFGWGIDASRVWDAIPLHPHNAALQLWLELGVVGAALGALFWSYVWAQIGAVAHANRSNAGLFAAVAVAYLSIGGLSFGVWQEWWLALGALAVIACWTFAQAFPDGAPDPGLTELTPLQPIGPREP